MSAPDAFALLCKQERYLSNPPFWSSAKRAEQVAEAARRLNRLLQRLRLEAGLPPDGSGDRSPLIVTPDLIWGRPSFAAGTKAGGSRVRPGMTCLRSPPVPFALSLPYKPLHHDRPVRRRGGATTAIRL